MRIVAGRFKGKQLISPSDDSIRPTADRVRESMFNILASRLGPVFDGLRVLDLFAGSGTTGAVASALGREVVLVDDNPEAIAVMQRRMPDATLVG